jgi:sugar lactone lactonase YvrE
MAMRVEKRPRRGGSRHKGRALRLFLLLAFLWGGPSLASGPAVAILLFGKVDKGLEEVMSAPVAPGGMTITPEGEYIISAHQFYPGSNYKVIRYDKKDSRWVPFPNLEMNTGQASTNLDAVLGLKCDEDGIVWMLDNGRSSEKSPKLIAWDTRKDRQHRVIVLQDEALVETSFVNDLALDPEEPFIYISDPASGPDAALIVVDLTTTTSRRVLAGSMFVRPQEGVELLIDGEKVAKKKPDGTREQAMRGVNPIAIDRKGNWLYFGAMNSDTLFRIPTRVLRDPKPRALGEYQIETYGRKPRICDSMSIDVKGNLYFGDVQAGAITQHLLKEEPTNQYGLLVHDPRITWPDGLCFGTDGKLHFFCSQLNRSAVYNGKSAPTAPFQIFKIRGTAEGMVGR